MTIVNQGRILLFDQHGEKLYKALSENARRLQIGAIGGCVMWKRKDGKQATVIVSLHTLISCEKLQVRTEGSGPELVFRFASLSKRTTVGQELRRPVWSFPLGSLDGSCFPAIKN
jgi:hypothetical protein